MNTPTSNQTITTQFLYDRVRCQVKGLVSACGPGGDSGQVRELLDGLLRTMRAFGIKPSPPSLRDIGPAPRRKMTKRQMQVLVGMSEGKSNHLIGRELHLSEATVKTHTQRVYGKLGVHDRAHAVARAYEIGLLS